MIHEDGCIDWYHYTFPADENIEDDVDGSIDFAEKSIKSAKSDSNKNILRENIKSNKFTLKVLKQYDKILEKQKKSLERASEITKEQITVAYSTYDTAANSANLVSLINETEDSFNKILDMQLPEIIPFENTELDRERLVVLQEIAQSLDTPEDLVFDYFQGIAFPEQPIGQPVLGFPKFIKKISRKDLISYRNTHYIPSRMVLSAAGNLDHDGFVGMIQNAFIKLNPENDSEFSRAQYIGGDRREVRPLEQTHLVLGFEGASFADPKFYPISLAATILGGGMSSRLFQKIREELGLAYSIYAFSASYTDSGLFGIYVGTGQEGLKELLPILCDELRKATTNITEKELFRAKMQLKAGIVMSLESTAARTEQIARQVAVFGRVLPIDELIERVQSVDLQTVMDTIESCLNGKPTVAAVGL